ncbi:restriction endonuclease subunit S [Chryseobacterium gleum]|uniref:restriction endonuclease subunit S n=1 Tax=Chryseobacterium gleum TaxID=250 RepID=UPI001E38348C|nr:restriction endonuclease subunit S [Chryseobacterium gleum]MCD9616894.1 restriction endonuclease subunit S [Chryseobacterium gleum]
MTEENKSVKNFPTKLPKLRFPGFKESWGLKKLGELLEFKNGINASKEQYGSGIKFINVLDILSNDFITYENIVGKVNVDEKTVEKFLVSYGDVLFQRSSETREEVGTANVYLDKNKNATFGGFVIRGKKIGDYNPIFFNKLLKTNSARESITSKSGGSTRFNVGQEILSSVNLYFPNLFEQDKIASFLSIIDERIQTQRKIIEKLESLMKVSRENIFLQKIKFKDYNFPKWEEKKLGDILIESNEKSIKNNQYRVISSTAKGLFYQDDYFTRDIASQDNTGYKILKKEQLVFSPQNLWLGNINVNIDFEIGIVSPSYKIFNFNTSLTSYSYCNFFLKTSLMLFEYAQSSIQGASVVRRNLDLNMFFNIKILLPSINEQIKIASFLSSIQEKIETEKQILEKLELQKKFLLANLFI